MIEVAGGAAVCSILLVPVGGVSLGGSWWWEGPSESLWMGVRWEGEAGRDCFFEELC